MIIGATPVRSASVRNRLRLSRRYLIFAATVLSMVALAAFRVADAPPGVILLLQAAFIVALIVLVVTDLPGAVGLSMIELAIGGASGTWTVLPGGVSGRIAVLLVVFVGACSWLAVDWWRTRSFSLGRYGLHAVIVALAMPVIWLPLGLVNGSGLRNAVLDGNGYTFLAFTLAFVALLKRGEGVAIRNWLLVACMVNAVLTGLLVLAAITEVIPLYPTLARVIEGSSTGLGLGGSVGYMPSGAGRLYLGSGLYLQIGLVLVVWRLLSDRTGAWPWFALAVLLIDIAATYTRGFWLASVVALAIVVVLGARDWRGPYRVVAGSGAVLVLAMAGGIFLGASVPDYLLQRAGSVLSTRPVETPDDGSLGQQPVQPTPAPGSGTDVLGEMSNEIKVVQARVLIGHIVERPLIGSGFGAVAPDYPFGSGFTYELTYLDLLFKTGIIGALLFLSFPLRLLIDAFRARFGGLRPKSIDAREASIPIACIASVLVASATNPYLLAAYGLMPILAMVAWLDPLGDGERT